MVCSGCLRNWHSACVGLQGLTQSITAKIGPSPWKCPCCFKFSPQIRAKLGISEIEPESSTSESEGESHEGDENVTNLMHRDIKEIKRILINKVVPNTNGDNASIKIRDTLNENLRRQTQSWSELWIDKQAQSQKKIEEAIIEQQRQVVDNIDTSRMKQERDHIEREKRKRNVVIRYIPESKKQSYRDQKEEDIKTVSEIMDLDLEYIVDVRRAGPPKPNYDRNVIITLSTPDLAGEMCNYGKGRRQENDDGSVFFWINADLIQADRTANYNARVTARNRRQNHHHRERSSSQRQNEDVRPDQDLPNRRRDPSAGRRGSSARTLITPDRDTRRISNSESDFY